MRRQLLLCLLVLVLFGGAIYWGYVGTQVANERAEVEQAQGVCCGIPVPTNRGPEVPDGFRGEVHPLLTRHAETEVRAYWDPEKVKTAHLLPGLPADLDPVRRLYLGVGVAVPSQSYSERDFSALLPPEGVTAAGQAWALDPERVAVFLKQFHPTAEARSASVGRRPGPDGAFAVLRATSPSYLDVVFRVHAEFDLVPPSADFPARHVWYTPAAFLGRVVVNRTEGAVAYFQLGVPTDEVKNVHGAVLTAPDPDHPEGYRVYQFLRADRMELVGGALPDLGGYVWADQVEPARAYERLAKLFYKFKEIDFLPFRDALAAARARNRPIFAVVALGALDDQSC